MDNRHIKLTPSLLALALGVVAGCASSDSGRTAMSSEPPLAHVCEQSSMDRSYIATCATSMSLQPDTPINDIPSSVQVITRPVIDDQKALRVGDALRNVSGVQGGGR